MKKLSLLAAVTVSAMFLAFKPLSISNWTSDSVHSRLGFTVLHMGVTDFYGSFNTYEVKISGDKPDFSDAMVELSADANSLNTGMEARDKHMVSADFLDAEKFPKLTFKSTSFKKSSGKNEYIVAGQFTMHGITKEVILKAKQNGTAIHPMTKKEITGFHVTGTIKRTDFGIGASVPSTMLGDEINLIADLEMTKD